MSSAFDARHVCFVSVLRDFAGISWSLRKVRAWKYHNVGSYTWSVPAPDFSESCTFSILCDSWFYMYWSFSLHLLLCSLGTFPGIFQPTQRKLHLSFVCCCNHLFLLSTGLVNFYKLRCTPIGMSSLLLCQTCWRYEIWKTTDFIAQLNWRSPQTVN